jgi:hypothetical protein
VSGLSESNTLPGVHLTGMIGHNNLKRKPERPVETAVPSGAGPRTLRRYERPLAERRMPDGLIDRNSGES